MLRFLPFAVPVLMSFAAIASCSSNASNTPASDAGADVAVPDAGASVDAADTDANLVMTASDFECILRWKLVRAFRITNKLGNDAGTFEVAASLDGGTYPVGTVIQLIPNEAMVKRRPGFSPATRDWEFFSLNTSSSGTLISSRGGAEVVNALGGSCATCHSGAAPQFDFVCETTHGCNPLPFTAEGIASIQNGDPRCP